MCIEVGEQETGANKIRTIERVVTGLRLCGNYSTVGWTMSWSGTEPLQRQTLMVQVMVKAYKALESYEELQLLRPLDRVLFWAESSSRCGAWRLETANECRTLL